MRVAGAGNLLLNLLDILEITIHNALPDSNHRDHRSMNIMKRRKILQQKEDRRKSFALAVRSPLLHTVHRLFIGGLWGVSKIGRQSTIRLCEVDSISREAAVDSERTNHVFLPVNLFRSAELPGDSSSSDHLSASSPTANIVSPSSDCRAGWLSFTGLGGTGERGPPSRTASGERASSSSSEPPKEAISKPSSSCAI